MDDDITVMVVAIILAPGFWLPGAVGILVRFSSSFSFSNRLAVLLSEKGAASMCQCPLLVTGTAKVSTSVSASPWSQLGSGFTCIDGGDFANS